MIMSYTSWLTNAWVFNPCCKDINPCPKTTELSMKDLAGQTQHTSEENCEQLQNIPVTLQSMMVGLILQLMGRVQKWENSKACMTEVLSNEIRTKTCFALL